MASAESRSRVVARAPDPLPAKPPTTKFSCVEFFDDGPDEQGRRHFALTWWRAHEPDDLRQTHVTIDGVTYCKRGQHFFADPRNYVIPRCDNGITVT